MMIRLQTKLQYDIAKEAEKILALSSAKINKYEHLSSEEMLPCNQTRKLFKNI